MDSNKIAESRTLEELKHRIENLREKIEELLKDINMISKEVYTLESIHKDSKEVNKE